MNPPHSGKLAMSFQNKYLFRTVLCNTIVDALKGCILYQVLGAYGRDTLNDNDWRLLELSVFSSTRSSVHPSVESHPRFKWSNAGNHRCYLDDIHTRETLYEMSLCADLLQ